MTTVGELRSKLEFVKGALPAEASMRMIPIVHSFCFTSDGQVFSYDDILLERVGGTNRVRGGGTTGPMGFTTGIRREERTETFYREG